MYNTHNLGFGALDQQLVIMSYSLCPFTMQPQLNPMVSSISLFVTKMV